jgi:chaperonin cofactor prefoldin
MKAKWVIMLVIVSILVTLGILQTSHVIDIKWQGLSIVIAALMAPFKFLSSLLSSRQEKIDAIKSEHDLIRGQENDYQKQLEKRIQDREVKIEILNKQVDNLNSRVETLEDQTKNVDKKVDSMSINEKKQDFTELFGQ